MHRQGQPTGTQIRLNILVYVLVTGLLPPSLERAIATWTTPPARLLHHRIPRLLTSAVDPEPVTPPWVGRNTPDRLDREPIPPLQISNHRSAHNPVLTGRDVDDFGQVDYVADPFLIPDEGEWHMFFEVYNRSRYPTGAIGHATSENGYDWRYNGLVLTHVVHLSYPYVFKWDGEYYLVPDQQRPESDARVTLFRADPFPSRWTPVTTIVSPPRRTSDHVVIRFNDRWWCFVGHQPTGSLYCYFSDDLLETDWTAHEANPVVWNRPHASRPGGRPLVSDDHIVIFYQDCDGGYGRRLYAYRITELSPDTFAEHRFQDAPVASGDGLVGWRSGRMHHIDPWPVEDGFMCAVDGDIALGRHSWASAQWSIGICEFERVARLGWTDTIS